MYNEEKTYDVAAETAEDLGCVQEGAQNVQEGTQNAHEGTSDVVNKKKTYSHDMHTATICGVVAAPFVYDHAVFGEKFYTTKIKVTRMSGVHDFVPILVSDRLVNVHEDMTGLPVEVLGQIRSHNLTDNDRKRLVINVFVKVWNVFEGEFDEVEDSVNEISFMGYVCKPPVHRETMLGREITDMLLAVNLAYAKSAYIPCIAWGRNSKYAATFDVGQNVKIVGRLQSRDYDKTLPDGTVETRTAFEVSISKLTV